MDYFYLSNQEMSLRKGAQAMSTKELQNKLREMGKSIKGQTVSYTHLTLPTIE